MSTNIGRARGREVASSKNRRRCWVENSLGKTMRNSRVLSGLTEEEWMTRGTRARSPRPKALAACLRTSTPPTTEQREGEWKTRGTRARSPRPKALAARLSTSTLPTTEQREEWRGVPGRVSQLVLRGVVAPPRNRRKERRAIVMDSRRAASGRGRPRLPPGSAKSPSDEPNTAALVEASTIRDASRVSRPSHAACTPIDGVRRECETPDEQGNQPLC